MPAAPGTSIGMRSVRPSPSSSLRGRPVGREQLLSDVLDDALLRHRRFDQAALVDVLGGGAFRGMAPRPPPPLGRRRLSDVLGPEATRAETGAPKANRPGPRRAPG